MNQFEAENFFYKNMASFAFHPGISWSEGKKMKNLLPVPEKYAFDDTPKAFTRMMQRKNGILFNEEMNKNKKQKLNDNSIMKRSFEHKNFIKDSRKISPSSSSFKKIVESPPLILSKLRVKRKAHLQARDQKKKLKRSDQILENYGTNHSIRKDVRDVVQEPPKLHQPKKTFKKVRDVKEEVKNWNEEDDEDLSRDDDFNYDEED